MKREQSAAVVTVFRASQMTRGGRKRIAEWLRKQATVVQNHGDQLASRYTARYLYK